MRSFVLSSVLMLAGSPALAEFTPGRLYVSVVPAHGFPDQPTNAVFEFDPLTGQSRLFAAMPAAIDGRISGLCFSPDGSTLYASLYQSNTIAAIQSDGTVSSAYTAADGLGGPIGANNLDFDARGNFYVGNDWTREILRFPANGGPASVVSDDADVGPLTVAPTGQVYHAWEGGPTVWRVDGTGNSVTFDALPGGITSMTSNSANELFVMLNTSLYKYTNGDPSTRTLLTSSGIAGSSDKAIALSPDESTLYVTSSYRVYSVLLSTGMATLVGELIPGYPAFPGDGLAVYVPEPTSLTLLAALAFGVSGLRSRR